MINGHNVMAVIPARGGSKRVPRKNLRLYKGRSLIEWTVRTALDSKYIDDVIFSSDDEEMRDAALRAGCPITLRRPPMLATDDAMNESVIINCIYYCGVAHYQWAVLFQPTSPQRTVDDIDACVELAQAGDGCISVNENGDRNGAVYVVRVPKLMATLTLAEGIYYSMPAERSLDIDEEWQLAG